MTDAEPPVEPVTQSGAKTAKKAFEKVAKKKPDPAGLALAEEAQAALTGKDFATAKEKFQRAQALCEASDAKPAARPKPAKPAGDAGGANSDAYGDDGSTNAPAGCPAWPESVASVWFHCHRALLFAALPASREATPTPALASPPPAAARNESRGNASSAVVEGRCL